MSGYPMVGLTGIHEEKNAHKKHGQWLKSDLVNSQLYKGFFLLFRFLKLTQSIERKSNSSMCCFFERFDLFEYIKLS